jgi:hypothetical protein
MWIGLAALFGTRSVSMWMRAGVGVGSDRCCRARFAKRGVDAAEAGAQKESSVATKAQVEKAIFEREGFRVELELFGEKRQTLPPYDFSEMAPQRWKVSDWKNARLDAYRLLAKGVKIYLGNGTPITRDLRLGNLRDTYFEAAHGSLQPPSGETSKTASVTPLRPRRTW